MSAAVMNPWGSASAAVWARVAAWGWTTHRMTARVGEAVPVPRFAPRPCSEHVYTPPKFPGVCKTEGCSYA